MNNASDKSALERMFGLERHWYDPVENGSKIGTQERSPIRVNLDQFRGRVLRLIAKKSPKGEVDIILEDPRTQESVVTFRIQEGEYPLITPENYQGPELSDLLELGHKRSLKIGF